MSPGLERPSIDLQKWADSSLWPPLFSYISLFVPYLVFQEESDAKEAVQKAKVIETEGESGKQEKKAVTEDGEVIYLGYSKS